MWEFLTMRDMANTRVYSVIIFWCVAGEGKMGRRPGSWKYDVSLSTVSQEYVNPSISYLNLVLLAQKNGGSSPNSLEI